MVYFQIVNPGITIGDSSFRFAAFGMTSHGRLVR
jgi:hypothetical protein